MRVTAPHVQGSRPCAQAIAGASQAERGWKKVPCPRPRRQGNLPDSRAGTPPREHRVAGDAHGVAGFVQGQQAPGHMKIGPLEGPGSARPHEHEGDRGVPQAGRGQDRDPPALGEPDDGDRPRRDATPKEAVHLPCDVRREGIRVGPGRVVDRLGPRTPRAASCPGSRRTRRCRRRDRWGGGRRCPRRSVRGDRSRTAARPAPVPGWQAARAGRTREPSVGAWVRGIG